MIVVSPSFGFDPQLHPENSSLTSLIESRFLNFHHYLHIPLLASISK